MIATDLNKKNKCLIQQQYSKQAPDADPTAIQFFIGTMKALYFIQL